VLYHKENLHLFKPFCPADNNITCNGTSLCPDGCTCCMGTVQKWECCPLPQAVCCADYRHCCPHDVTPTYSLCLGLRRYLRTRGRMWR
uniref:Granulins domain-containing protein n=1 Tax=Gouania willdenowi TaxID=441366 RepID=A0A8C5NF21_GOUWI